MTTATTTYVPTIFDRARELWRRQPPLAAFTVAMAFLTLLFVTGVFVDDRLIGGQPAWMKPVKFGISMVVYTGTIVWLLGFVRSEQPRVRRGVSIFAWIVVVVFVIEIAAIAMQALRGTTSHFNIATRFDDTVFLIMGVAITVLWLANFLLVAVMQALRIENRALALSLRLAVVLSMIGMAQAFFMIMPTTQQLAGWRAGETATVRGAHSVGLPDGGPGLPVVGWRTDVGDLRIGHFVGIHALQVLPLVGWFLSRRRLAIPQQASLVWIAAAAYLAVMALLTWQALRAQPLLTPDGLTLGVLAGILVASAAAAAIVLRRRAD